MTLKKKFQHVSEAKHPVRMFKRDWEKWLELKHQPALDFERQAGIRGIAGRYVYPENVTPSEIEHAIKPFLHNVTVAFSVKKPVMEIYQSMWRGLKRLNPELKQVKLDPHDFYEIQTALLGVVSGFNTDDINYFLAGGRKGAALRGAQVAKKYIESRVGMEMAWAPAPKTLERILEKLDRKHGVETTKRRRPGAHLRPKP